MFGFLHKIRMYFYRQFSYFSIDGTSIDELAFSQPQQIRSVKHGDIVIE
jgi:hypothetical protein